MAILSLPNLPPPLPFPSPPLPSPALPPSCLLQGIYHALGGSQKGIGMKDLFCGLVLLTHGTIDEKAKCKSEFDLSE